MKTKLLPLILAACLYSCSTKDDSKNSGGTYVSPSINYKGQFRKGHFRKAMSTDKNVYKNRSRSKYYYQTRGKYRRKKKNN
jgi:hypothetical protein